MLRVPSDQPCNRRLIMEAALIETGMETVARFTPDVTLHSTTLFNELSTQDRRIYITLPKITLVVLLALELFTTEEPFLPVKSATECLIPLTNTTYLDQVTTFSIWVDYITTELSAKNKSVRMLTLFRALFRTDTYIVFQFSVPFRNPRITSYQMIDIPFEDVRREISLIYFMSYYLSLN